MRREIPAPVDTTFWRTALTLRFASVALAASLVSGAATAANNPETTQWILATAKATGGGGEQFVSSLRITNPNTVTATVGLAYLAQSGLDGSFTATGNNSAPATITVTVEAGRTLAIEDVVGTKFASAAPFGIVAGGIRVTSNVPVSVQSRTYNAAARNQAGVAGTFGISIPSQSEAEAVAEGDTAYVSYLATAPDRTSGYRSNFIFLNTAATDAVVRVKLVKPDGTSVGERDYGLAPFANTQQGDIVKSHGYNGPDENVTAVVTVTSGGPVVVGATVLDNAIGSSNYVSPSKSWLPNNGAFGLILEDGGYGFSGRLDIFQGTPDFLSAGVVLEGCPAPNPVQLFYVQAFTTGANANTTFTRNPDGSWRWNGSSSSATWSGTVYGDVDGTVFGTLTYARATGTAGGSCPGVSKTMAFQGARGQVFLTNP